MKTEEYTTTVLTPEEGRLLTQVADVDIRERIVATSVALGRNDSAAGWREITEAEGEEYRRLRREAEAAAIAAIEARHLQPEEEAGLKPEAQTNLAT